ncbi:hypothetical protein HanRHA438_Chr15g0720171 [Helianthus annuus]|nr:hypothetical protein HanRHA438_Chr15g0720171 [Helianthus annuus]
MVMLGQSWSVSDLIHSPHEHQLSQSTVCIDLVLKYCSVWLFFNFFYCSKLMVENGAPPVVMVANKDEIMTKVDANIHNVMEMDVEATEKPSESSPMTTVALQEQKNASTSAGLDYLVGESSSYKCIPAEKTEENHLSFNLNDQIAPLEFHVESGIEAAPNIEHQFISSFPSHQMGTYENSNLQIHQSSLRNGLEEISIGLQLSEPELKRRKQYDEDA